MMPSRQLATLGALILIAMLGCYLPGERDPAEGSCSGQIAGESIDGLQIDLNSEFHHSWAPTCTGTDRTVINLSYGNSKLRTHGVKLGLVSVLADQDLQLPTSPTTPTNSIERWIIRRPTDAGDLKSGSIRLERKSNSRLTGDFDMTMQNNDQLSCTFNLPFDDSNDEGERPDCGSSSGGGTDFD